MENGLRVRVWGTRGSCPAPFANRMGYGGNTSCVSVSFAGGMVIFDAGTGIAALGRWMEEECRQGRWDAGLPIHIFIGHLHLDHIQGLMLFSWLFRKGAEIHIYGLTDGETSFRQRLAFVFGPPYWPVSVGQVPAAITWHELRGEETIRLSGGARIRTMQAAHPNGGLVFRMESGDRSVVYGLDCELENDSGMAVGSGGMNRPMWERYREFAKACDLLIFDAPYTKEEYPAFRGFGHGFWEQGLRMAAECHAARLIICHHDWGRPDGELKKLERSLKEQAAGLGIDAEFAREEQCL